MPDLLLSLRNLGSSTKPAKGPESYRPSGSNQSASITIRHALESPKSLGHPHSSFPAVHSTPSSTPFPTPTLRHQITSFSNISEESTLDTPRAVPSSKPSGFDAFPNNSIRSSVYSQYTHTSVAPAVAIDQGMRVRTSRSSMPSFRTQSNGSSPTSPLAHHVSIPRTPPPILVYAPRIVTSPTEQSPASYKSGQSWLSRADSESEEEFPRRRVHMGFLDKAKGARKAWRRRQQDVKHEKLKASIQVIGPTESTVDSVRVMRNGRALVDAGAQNIVPAHLATGAF